LRARLFLFLAAAIQVSRDDHAMTVSCFSRVFAS
jgi:hypothetical protein